MTEDQYGAAVRGVIQFLFISNINNQEISVRTLPVELICYLFNIHKQMVLGFEIVYECALSLFFSKRHAYHAQKFTGRKGNPCKYILTKREKNRRDRDGRDSE